MRRREFILGIGAAIAFPPVARAQQAIIPVIGYLGSATSEQWAGLVNGFREGLVQAGFIEGQNVIIDFHWAENQLDRLPGLAAELASRQPAVIVASGGTATALAAKAATSSVPLVFVIGADPVKWGLVASLNRPGGNVTGLSFLVDALLAKRLEVLRGLVPNGGSIGVLRNSQNPNSAANLADVRGAAGSLQQEIHVVDVNRDSDFEKAFASLAEHRVAALFVIPDPYLYARRALIIAQAARLALPAIYDRRETVVDGGLISYGPSVTEANRQAGTYAARILKGTKPADLPVMQATKIELIINLKTAKTLGLELSPSLLARADAVVE